MLTGFKEGDIVSAVVFVKSATKGTARNKNEFFKLIVNDGTSDIDAFVWDEELFDKIKTDCSIKVKAKYSKYNGKDKLDITEFIETKEKVKLPSLSDDEKKNYIKRLEILIGQITDPEYKQLFNDVFDSVKPLFLIAPAAKRNHHAYLGGLLQHTVEVAEICVSTYKQNPKNLNLSLLICGALLHDVGKIKSYTYDKIIDRSTTGKLLEHISLGLMILTRLIPANFPIKKINSVCHLIVSHHGKRDWGSPVEPLMKEAVILHQADMINSYTARFDELAEASKDKEWTEFDNTYNRSWYLENK